MTAVAALLLAAALAPTRATMTADAACDAALTGLVASYLGACSASGGACPASCATLFEGALGTCEGKYYTDPATQKVELFQPGILFSGYALLLDAACQDPVINVVLKSDTYDATCSDAGSILSVGSILWCANETLPCPPICQTAMQATHSACQSTDTVTVNGEGQPASQAVVGAKFFMSPDCVAEINTCSFGSGCTFDSAPEDSVGILAASLSTRVATLSALVVGWLAMLIEGVH